MSEQVPVQLIVAAFQNEDGAGEAWKQLKAAKWGGLIKIDRMAIVRRSTKDKVKIRESGDPGGGRGAVVGAVVGGIIGSIAGPLGAVVVGGAAGAAVGGITAKFYDSGIPNHRLETIGQALKPGTSAIVAIIEHKWVRDLENDLREAGADVMTEALSADIAQQLAAGNEMSFTAIGGEEGMAVARTVSGEKEMEAVTTNQEDVAVLDLMTDEETAGAGVITSEEVESTEGAGVITGDDKT